MPTTHTTTHPARPRWATVGEARRFGDGLRIEVRNGPQAGIYAIGAYDVLNLFLTCETAPLWRLAPETGTAPIRCGEVSLSESGRMLVVTDARTGRYGNLQIPGDAIAARYLANDPAPVPVLSPPLAVPA